MKKIVFEIIGWYGALAILLAYVLVTFGKVEPQGLIYQLLNFSGAIGIMRL